jgi:NitT/TauT family transport system permease protein
MGGGAMIARLRGLAVPALLVLAWELGGRNGVLPADTLSRPTAIAVACWAALADGSLLTATIQTFRSALLGLAIGSAIGIGIGLPLGLSRALEAIVGPTVDALRPVPAVALIPLALLVYGFGTGMEAAVVAFACIWPVLVVAVSAARQIEPRLIEVARVLELPARARLLRIVLPATLARIAVGVRISAGVALIVAVTVEVALNPQGLGHGMTMAAQGMRPELMWAELLWVGFVGWGFNALLVGGERRWLKRYAVGGPQG